MKNGRSIGNDEGKQAVAARFILTKEIRKVFPPTKLYWARDTRGLAYEGAT